MEKTLSSTVKQEKSSKFFSIFWIVVMMVSLASFGVYLGNPSKATANMQKFLGLYGVGDGLFPMSNSKIGEVQQVHLNGSSTLFLECFTTNSLEKIILYYQNILEKSSFQMDPKVFSATKRQEYPKDFLRKGVVRLEGAGYNMLGTVNKEGEHLGVIAYQIPSGSKYYLYHSEKKTIESKEENSFSMPFSSLLFHIEKKQKKQSFYFYKCTLNPKKALSYYEKVFSGQGWRQKRSFGNSLQGKSLVFEKNDFQTIIQFHPNYKNEETDVLVVVHPKKKKL